MNHIFDLINEIVATLDRFDADRCLGNICSNLLAVTGGGGCFIFLSDPEHGLMDVTSARGEACPPVGLDAEKAREMAGVVMERGKWTLWSDWREPGARTSHEPVAGIPLRAFDRLIGAMIVVRHERPFDEGQIQALLPIANIVALAVPRDELDGFAKLAEICIRFLEEKDPYTHGHSLRVMRYSLSIASRMGLGPGQLRDLRLCSLLHDIGKVIIKDSILSKKEALTRQEMQAIKMHPSIGSNITQRISPSISDKILAHHERFDGQGYPSGLSGEDIPIISRIIAVADALDAMTSRRPYRSACDIEDALAEISKHSGTQFDPDVVKALEAVFSEGRLDLVKV